MFIKAGSSHSNPPASICLLPEFKRLRFGLLLVNKFENTITMGFRKDFDLDEFDRKLGAVCCRGTLGRKRIVPSPCGSPFRTPLKRQRSVKLDSMSLLETMPQDILIKILCGVEHEDLARLMHVSKSIKDATLIAKECHFAFRTPLTKTKAKMVQSFGGGEDLEIDSCHLNAPKQRSRCQSVASRRNLADISVALFHSFDEE